mmetsp:Transcript_23345/g.49717  ORF Transcript_23345/g.49717 Transcript_23345/m.49717 type:complete len:241 (+) Transcript_23345:613-1335(+)
MVDPRTDIAFRSMGETGGRGRRCSFVLVLVVVVVIVVLCIQVADTGPGAIVSGTLLLLLLLGGIVVQNPVQEGVFLFSKDRGDYRKGFLVVRVCVILQLAAVVATITLIVPIAGAIANHRGKDALQPLIDRTLRTAKDQCSGNHNLFGGRPVFFWPKFVPSFAVFTATGPQQDKQSLESQAVEIQIVAGQQFKAGVDGVGAAALVVVLFLALFATLGDLINDTRVVACRGIGRNAFGFDC